MMNKILIIIVISFLFNTNVRADTATCFGDNCEMATCFEGECEFLSSKHYEWAETTCIDTLIEEEVETNFVSFIIKDTGEECFILDSR